MSGKLKAVIDQRWDIAEGGKVDVSTSSRYLTFKTPTDFQLNQVLGSTSTVTFNPQVQSAWSFFDEAYFMIQLQARDSVSHAAYPAGAAVALNPDFSATFINNYYFQFGGQQIELESNYSPQSTFISNLQDYSWDYAVSERGQTDVFILDAPGQTQYSGTGQSASLNQLSSISLSNLVIIDTTQQIYCKLVAYSATVLGVTSTGVSSNPASQTVGTLTAGNALTLNVVGPNGQLIPVFATDFTAGQNVNTFTVGTVVSGVAPIILTAPGNFTAGDVIDLFAGNQQLQLFDASQTKPGLLALTATTSTSVTSTVTIGAITTIVAGDLITTNYINPDSFNNGNTGFWRRQALTDNGKICTLRIPIRNFVKFFRDYKDGLYGQAVELKLFTQTNQINQICQVAQGLNPAEIYIIDWQLVVPCEEPTSRLAQHLSKWLHAQQPKNFIWRPRYTQTCPQLQAGNNSYAANITFPPDPVQWLVLMFQPASYQYSPNQNPQCSLIPALLPTQSNPIANAFITYGPHRYPKNSPYGQNKSDVMQQHAVFLDFCGRWDTSLMGPCITYTQWLNNYMLLCFDLRGRAEDNTPASATTTLQLQFTNYFTQAMNVFAYTESARHCQFTGVNGVMIFSSPNGTI